MSLSRYEEIFMRLVAADISAGDTDDHQGFYAVDAANSIRHYAAQTAKFEKHFQEREHALDQERWAHTGVPGTSALLKRQAE